MGTFDINPDPPEPVDQIKMEGSGPGATTLAMKVDEGKVMLAFPKPVQWVRLDPDVAARIADAMIAAAVELGVQITIPVPKKAINPVHRQATVVRVQNVLRQLQERGRRPEYIAEELTEIVIKALL